LFPDSHDKNDRLGVANIGPFEKSHKTAVKDIMDTWGVYAEDIQGWFTHVFFHIRLLKLTLPKDAEHEGLAGQAIRQGK
jgi:hypothetical protein